MRIFLLLLLMSVLTCAANAQKPVNIIQPVPDLKILNASWQAIGGDDVSDYFPFEVATFTTVGFDTLLRRTPTGWNHRTSTHKSSVNCTARVVIQNTSNKTVRSFSLNFLFIDPKTQGEFLRYEFRSRKKIGPNQSRKFTQDTFQKVGKYRKLYTPAKPQRDLLVRTKDALTKVVVTRIEYSDGSVCEIP